MKKFILSTVLCFGLSITYAGEIKVTKNNGGFFGYKKITEVHSSEGNHSLDCKDGGWDDCIWQTEPSIAANADIIFATTQVSLGVLSGVQTFTEPIRTVIWSGINVNNMMINIVIE